MKLELYRVAADFQGRMDSYFRRVGDIIKKSRIPLRIKFMLQDVQELRSNDWVPRPRQNMYQLKTIEQASLSLS